MLELSYEEENYTLNEIIFDKSQLSIIKSSAKKICVIAGAGSGKTACIVARVRRLLEEGKNPSGFVCITFTNMAAEEMRQRLSDLPCNGMFIGTIHSFALHILRQNHIKLELLTPERENEIAIELIQKYGKYLTVDKFKEWTNKRRLKDIGYITNKELMAMLTKDETDELFCILDTINIKDLYNSDKSQLDELAEKILEAEYCAHTSNDYPETVTSVATERGLITFNKLLDCCTENNQVPKIEYLFVDEFQDVGVFEFRFLNALNAKNVFVVGDDFQSIFSFKGADFEYFKSLTERSDYTTYKLENNYRSVKKIVDEGNSIIENISDVIPKKCVSKVKAIAPPTIIHCKGGISRVMDYAKFIDSRDYSKWFILTRSNSDAVKASRACYREGIPAMIFKKGAMDLRQMQQSMQENSIKILTIHTAKGLENDNIILWGEFPTNDEIGGYYGTKEHPTEECRIYYVGVTRARKNLVVVHKPPAFTSSKSNLN